MSFVFLFFFFFLTLQKNFNSIFVEHFWLLNPCFWEEDNFSLSIERFFSPVGSRGGWVVLDVKKCKKVQIVGFFVYRPPRANLDAGIRVFLGCISVMPSFARVFRIL